MCWWEDEDFYAKKRDIFTYMSDISPVLFKVLLYIDLVYLAYRLVNYKNISLLSQLLLDMAMLLFRRLPYLGHRCIDFLYCLGTSLFVLQNKVLLSGKPLNFFAPLFITWYRFFIMTVIMFIWGRKPELLPSVDRPYRNPLHWSTMKKVLPLAALYMIKTISENTCLMYSDASFYFLGISLVPFFHAILSYKVSGKPPSKYTCWACTLMFSGFMFGVKHEYFAGTFSVFGTILSILSSLLCALYAIFVNRALPHVNNELWVINYFNDLYSTVLLLPFLVFERKEIVNKLMPLNFGVYQVLIFVALALSGVVTMIYKLIHMERDINISVPKLDKRGITRSHFQIGILTYWFGERKPISWWMASIIASFGSEWYLIEKLQVQERQRKFFCVLFTIWLCIIVHYFTIYSLAIIAMFQNIKT